MGDEEKYTKMFGKMSRLNEQLKSMQIPSNEWANEIGRAHV